jgi:hypothetical protein
MPGDPWSPYGGMQGRELLVAVSHRLAEVDVPCTLPGRYRAEELVRARLREAGRIHGSEVLDLLVGCCWGSSVDGYDAEQLIKRLGLVPERADLPDPTPSQRAFIGLQFRKHPGYVPGAVLHFWHRVGDPVT